MNINLCGRKIMAVNNYFDIAKPITSTRLGKYLNIKLKQVQSPAFKNERAFKLKGSYSEGQQGLST